MMAGRVPYGERYWQTPLKQTAPLGPQDVKFGSVTCCTQPLSRTHVEAVRGWCRRSSAADRRRRRRGCRSRALADHQDAADIGRRGVTAEHQRTAAQLDL